MNVAALSLMVMRVSGRVPGARARTFQKRASFRAWRQERECMTRDDVSPTTTCRDGSSRPLCERLPSSQPLGADAHEVLAGPYSRCCSGGGVHENRTTTGGFRTAAIIWRTAGVAAARITTARGDITGTSCRECQSGNSTAEVCGTGEACAVVTRHLGFNPPRRRRRLRPLLRRSLWNHRRLRFAPSLFPPAHRSPYRC